MDTKVIGSLLLCICLFLSITTVAQESTGDYSETKLKEEWKEFYPDFPKNYLLIKVVPNLLELSAASMGIFSDQETWKPPAIIFDNKNQ